MITKQRLAAAAFALLTFVGITLIAAPSAYAASGTISGTVECFYGNNAEVGVWVNASSGTDGWATKSPNGTGISYSYTLSQSSSYRLHVGCGGTPQNWGATMYTPWVNGQTYDWVCSYSPSFGFFCAES